MRGGYIPRGNTAEDIKEAVNTAQLVFDLANKMLENIPGGTVLHKALIASLLAQIIDMRLWEQRRQNQE